MGALKKNGVAAKVLGKWDVVVAGGGPAGCAAAAAAAQEGKRVLLLEATGALGGMGTMGLIPAWCPFSDGKQIIYRGLAERVFLESKKGCPHVPPAMLDWVPINPEHLKRVYDNLLEEAGVEVLFFTMAAGVQLDGEKMTGVLIANKGGLACVQATVYIDCTGDGDLCAWGGARWEQGDAQGDTQPASHCFSLAPVSSAQYQADPPTRARIKAGADLSRYKRLSDLHLCNCLTGPGTVGFNAGHLWDIDGTDPRSLSNAVREGRKIAAEFRDVLAEALPGMFGGAHLAATAPLLGIRETRRIMGDYILTLSDYLARKSFADEICRNAYPVDIHPAKHEIQATRDEKIVIMERFERYKPGESHGIPYRCLVPGKLSNVLVAGRCISTDHPVQASTRVMPVALAMGEAAGVAAAQACAAAGETRAVDTDALRDRLRRRGAYLP